MSDRQERVDGVDLRIVPGEDAKDRKRRLSREFAKRRLQQIRRSATLMRLEVVLRDDIPPYGPTVARIHLRGQPFPAVDWWLTTGTTREVIPRGHGGAESQYCAWLPDVLRFLERLAPRAPK